MKKWLAVPAQYKFVCKLPDEVPQRCLPEDWAEIDHLTLPLVKDGTMLTYSPDELERLLAAAPARLFHAWPWALLRECGRQKLSALDGTISDLSQKVTPTGSLTWKLGSPKRTAGGPSRYTRRWPSGLIHTSGPSTGLAWHPQPLLPAPAANRQGRWHPVEVERAAAYLHFCVRCHRQKRALGCL